MNQHPKITISFLPSDSDLYNFIEIKKNTCNLSEYIRSLIRKDMTANTVESTDEKVIEKILQLLGNKECMLPFDDTPRTTTIPIDEETKNTINNLF